MRIKIAVLALALALAPATASIAQAQPAGQSQSAGQQRTRPPLPPMLFTLWRQEHPGQNFRQAWQAMSAADQQKLRQDLKARLDAMPQDQKNALKQRIQERRERRRARRNGGGRNAQNAGQADNSAVADDDTDDANAVNSPPADSTATGGNTMAGVPVTLLTAVVTLLALLFYFWTGFNVGRMRGKHGVKAPAMTGDPEFERSVRVQMNTLEWIVVFLPVLWLATMYFSPAMSMVYLSWLPPVLGIVWIIGRFMYMQGYMAAADKRGTGFMIAGIAVIALFVLDIIGIVMAWTAASAV
ncbi:MAG TPA: MAPEG family protein [Rhizomicrobium sp.]|jgi:glutathione S-transferase|nr:MAPEG family protein [Rhizomicrobium sp.]